MSSISSHLIIISFPFCLYDRFGLFNALSINLTAYQQLLTVTKTITSPLSLTSNVLTIDLSNYATISSTSGSYQPKLTVSTTTASPLILNNNTLSIDLSGYYQTRSKTLAEIYSTGLGTWVYLDTIYRLYSDPTFFLFKRMG